MIECVTKARGSCRFWHRANCTVTNNNLPAACLLHQSYQLWCATPTHRGAQISSTRSSKLVSCITAFNRQVIAIVHRHAHTWLVSSLCGQSLAPALVSSSAHLLSPRTCPGKRHRGAAACFRPRHLCLFEGGCMWKAKSPHEEPAACLPTSCVWNLSAPPHLGAAHHPTPPVCEKPRPLVWALQRISPGTERVCPHVSCSASAAG
mmetsp:Transcript_12834/g.35007  ORF Transcript_12834/g.35007 Transcript_12834/m.35007 type:complete len:205 (-) Transcript_12834:1849-2463(-)